MTHDYFLRRAIKYCGGKQKDLAARIKVKPCKISYMLNYACKIKMEDAVKIELAVDGAVKWYQLMEDDYHKIKEEIKEKFHYTFNTDDGTSSSFSEIMKKAMEYEKQLGKHQGRRTDLLREHSHEVLVGRTERHVAQLFHLGSEWTYRQAKKVMTTGIPELIKRLDQKHLKISVAAILARCSPEEQRAILLKSDKEIVVWVKEIKLSKH